MCIIIAGWYLVVGLAAMAKSDSSNPHAHAEGRKEAQRAGIALLLVSLGIIFTVILSLAG